MRGSEELRHSPELMVRVLPPLDPVRHSIERVIQRWPDAVSSPQPKEREQIAQDMCRRVREWDWKDITTQRIASAAVAVFDAERCNRDDLASVRDFYLAEISACQPGPFLDAMLGVYIDSFAAEKIHTRRIARALETRADDLGSRHSRLLAAVPHILKPAVAPIRLAAIMLAADDPFQAMKELGLRSPHGAGLMQSTHIAFVAGISKKLGRAEERQRLFNWLMPTGGTVLETGAASAIEALLAIWRNKAPPEALRQELSETIVAAYNDPRLHRGGIWSGFDPELKQILLRWLTRQHMKYFCDMVTATQDSHMWGPRRDFWLELDEDKRIDEAWVAFGASARRYAQHNLIQNDRQTRGLQFGSQQDRGANTSLLIMRIGNKIVVDGCHSYKTHIFRQDDPRAPKLYQSQYYCDDIMRSARNSKPHNSISAWSQWVLQHV
jgi:hypothetical protein